MIHEQGARWLNQFGQVFTGSNTNRCDTTFFKQTTNQTDGLVIEWSGRRGEEYVDTIFG